MTGPDLMGDDFRAWFEARLVTLHAWAAGNIQQGRTLSPAIIAFRDDGEMALMPVDMDTPAAKNLAAALHRLAAALAMFRHGAIMVSEAWLAPDGGADEAERKRMVREGIDHHPQRTEAVIWSALRGERQLIAMAKITRQPNRLGCFEIIDPQRELITGRMVHERQKGH